MSAMSWLHVRPRTLAGAAIVTAAAIGITTMAVAYEGNPTTELELHDGSVWITKAEASLVGHFNAESRVLDGQFGSPSADYDVLQDGSTVLVHQTSAATVGIVDTAAVSLGDAIQLPGDAQLDYSARTVAVLDPKKGAVYVVPVDGLPSFSAAEAKPVLDELGEGVDVTVARDGAVHVASSAKATVYTVPVTPEGAYDKDAGISEQKLEGVDEKSALSVSSVGERPVVLDATTGTVHIPGQDPVALQEPEDAKLALDAADGDAVIVATRTELLSLPLDGSEPTATPAGGFTGTPTAPVWLNGCAYGAWMESGRFMRDCIGGDGDLDMPIDKYRADGELRFRVNRDVVMLNNVFSGAAWLASDQLQKVDNWNDLTPPKSEDGVENPDPTTVQVPDPSPPDRGPDNTKPEAANDRFGVRAGGSTILPVLTGYEGDPEGGGTQGADSDPDGDVLVVSLTDDVPRNVDVVPVNNGNALQITVPEDVTTVEPFTYRVDDGRGGLDEAKVTIDVRPEEENTGPQQLRKIAVPVETGNAVTYNVLPDWIDPDGDNIFLQSVTAAEGDEVEFTADGRITYRAISGNQGIVEVNITVSDGHTSVTGVFPLDVRPASSQPPIATPDHLVVRAGQQGTVTPLANDLSASKEPLELTQVSEVEGATIVADFTDDSFTFRSNKAGTYYVDYLVATSGTSPVNGLVRVDVLEPIEKAEPPVAVRDVALLPAGGDALVNVLANDSDPAGGVLVVQRVSVEADSGVAVSVLGHETLRVADMGMTGRDPAQATVEYTISNGAETAVGEVVVLAMPKQAKVRPPIANDDTATVRVGDVVTIPVLENDNHPNDEEFHVAPDLGEQPAAGEAFVSQDTIRYRAGDEPGAVQFTYRAVDANGQHNSALVKVQILALDAENNNAPRPADIEARTLEDTVSTIEVPLDGIDPDGDSVDLVGVTGAGPKKGTVTLNEAGQFEYTAHDDVSGVDTFTYRVRDALGAEAEASIRVGIAPQTTENQAPFAVRDTLAMRPDRVVAAPVMENDNDPDGDRFALVPGKDGLILGEDPQIQAEVAGDRVLVTSPDQELETSLQYTIEDERGARARGVLSVVVDEDVPLQPPIARDDRIQIENVDIDTGTAEINLLANDEDPDGITEDLSVEVDEDQGVTVDGDGVARVEIEEERRLVGYRITDAEENTARAFIRVPGEEDLRPYLISTTPERVKSGDTIELPLAQYVTAPSGKDVRITTAENVSAAHSDGQNLVVDPQTLTYTSADRFAGNDAITFEVTDGSGPDDLDGRVSTLSIPILVTPPDNLPPEMRGASVTVGAGDPEPGTVDLAGLASDIDDDPVSFQVQETPAGMTAEIDGTTLQVRADADQKGTVANVVVLADDGAANPTSPEPVTANIEVTVTASTRELPVATDDTVSEWNQGETLTHDVLQNDANPFEGEAPLEVIGATLETGAAADADVSFDAGHVIVTPAADFHGRLVVRYRVQDMTGDPERTAEGRLNLTVQGVPDAPGKPTVSDVQSRQVTLSWQSPPDNGAAITEYRVQATKGGEYSTVCPETTCTLRGLTNNVTYGFTVTAVNRVGEGDPSPVSQDARPDVRPETPIAPQLPEFRDSGLLVSWKAPRTEGSPITTYELEITPTPPNGVNVREVPAGNTQLWWDGLANGTAYTVRVRAHNSAPDPSEWSGQSATNIPAKPPEAPGAPTATRQSAIGPEPGGIQVTWPAVDGTAAGGDPVDSYRVQAYQGGSAYGKAQTTSGTSAVFSLPASGSDYTFRVTARNKAGWGAESAPSAGLRQFTSPTTPGKPSVKPGDRQIQASWSPATAQGADEVRYQWNVGDGRGWQDVGTATSATIGGLQNGQTYHVTVRAYAVASGTNSEPGGSSAASDPVIPYGPLHPPVVHAERVGDGTQIRFSWDARQSANGRPITVRVTGAVSSSDVSGSFTGSYGYNDTRQITVTVTDTANQAVERSASERTVEPPKPSGSVSRGDKIDGPMDGCTSGQCWHPVLTYQNLPSGNYRVACETTNVKTDPNSNAAYHEFAARSYRLSGAPQQLTCYIGDDGYPVRLHVTGNGADFYTPAVLF